MPTSSISQSSKPTKKASMPICLIQVEEKEKSKIAVQLKKKESAEPNSKGQKLWQSDWCIETLAVRAEAWRKRQMSRRFFKTLSGSLLSSELARGPGRHGGWLKKLLRALTLHRYWQFGKVRRQNLRHSCSGKVQIFVHLSLYRGLKLLGLRKNNDVFWR